MINNGGVQDACYMCVHVGKMNKDGNITCNLLKIVAEPYYCCRDFKKK